MYNVKIIVYVLPLPFVVLFTLCHRSLPLFVILMQHNASRQCLSPCHIQPVTRRQCLALCHIQSDTRRQCLALCHIQPDTRRQCLAMCHIQPHTKRQCLPLCVILNIIEDGRTRSSVSYSTSCQTD